MNKSAIARIKRIAWNTVDRWLERASNWCRRFNDRKISKLSVVELQADEIRTIVRGKEQPIWVFAVIEVWLGFGLQRWSEDGATGTRWPCFEMFSNA